MIIASHLESEDFIDQCIIVVIMEAFTRTGTIIPHIGKQVYTTDTIGITLTTLTTAIYHTITATIIHIMTTHTIHTTTH